MTGSAPGTSAPSLPELNADGAPDRLTQDELAAFWRVSPRTLERWRAKGTGPAWVRVGGRVLYRMTDVLAFEQAHTARPSSGTANDITTPPPVPGTAAVV